MSDDRSIIEGLNRRDESALQAIRQQYGTYCHNLAYRILESHEDAEECVDDMLMAVWDSIPPQHPDSLQAYLITITARNVAAAPLRQRSTSSQTFSPRTSIWRTPSNSVSSAVRCKAFCSRSKPTQDKHSCAATSCRSRCRPSLKP